ncbi:MAG: DivIVA domain-containing protein [Candidatus Cloacimonetes bacterium]|nr:DivIVA domain-containing protein [Candidatus Cloacimonadota bacterium]
MPQNISPSEIRGKEFNKTLSGYSKQEVEEFLDLLADQIERLDGTIRAQQKEIEDRDKKLEDIEEQKEVLKRTLILAEKLKEDTLKSADKEAKNIIKDAEISAKERVKKAKDYLSILEHDYVNLKDKKKSFLLSFKSQINTILDLIESEFQKDKEDAREIEKPIIPPPDFKTHDFFKDTKLPPPVEKKKEELSKIEETIEEIQEEKPLEEEEVIEQKPRISFSNKEDEED